MKIDRKQHRYFSFKKYLVLLSVQLIAKKNTQQKADSDNKKQGKENVVDADFEEVKEDKKDKDKDKEKRA